MKNKLGNWIFGCDICQDVCPWNRFSSPNKEAGFTPLFEILHYSKEDWENISEESFKKIFRHSPLKRARFEGLKRNLRFVYNNE